MRGFGIARAVLVALIVLIATPVLGQQRILTFDVWLDERPIGEHRFTLTADPQGLSVLSEAEFDVSLLFIKLFSYEHQARERWQGGCLVKLDSITNSNGEAYQVSARRANQVFQISASTGKVNREHEGPPCPASFAYWDPAQLTRNELLNSQTGELEAATLEWLGEAPLPVTTGRSALRCQLTTDTGVIELWYDAADGSWLALRSKMDKRYLIYERRDLTALTGQPIVTKTI